MILFSRAVPSRTQYADYLTDTEKTKKTEDFVDLPDLPPLDCTSTASKTMRSLLLGDDTPLLSSEKKAASNSYDPVMNHLYQSRMFKTCICCLYLALMAIFGAMLGIPDGRIIILVTTGSFMAVLWPLSIACLICSRKLR